MRTQRTRRPPAELTDLWAAFHERGCDDARKALIVAHYGLVERQVRAYCRERPTLGWQHYEDLTQEGAFGLIAAVQSWKPERSSSFEAWAATCITRALQTAARRAGAASRTAHAHRLARTAAVEDLRAAGGAEPSPAEVAAALGISAAELARRDAAVPRVVPGPPAEDPAAPDATPEELVIRAETIERARGILAATDPLTRRLAAGLAAGLSQEALAAGAGLSRSQVRTRLAHLRVSA